MLPAAEDVCQPPWNMAAITALIDDLESLRKAMLEREAGLAPWVDAVAPARRASAANLAHYLALRQIDLRPIQDRLAGAGLSSLGRSETHVLANVDKVLGALHRIAGLPWRSLERDEPNGFHRGAALLAQHARALFGAAPAQRDVRIMVTLPSEAAFDPSLVTALVQGGMDIARINCAHDDAACWSEMADKVRLAAHQANRTVRILMDLGGPKLRTGPVVDGPAVVKLRPVRDAFGRVTQSARLGLVPAGSGQSVAGSQVSLGVDARWLSRLKVGERIDLADARSARRRLVVLERHETGVLVECDRTAYLCAATWLRLHRAGEATHRTAVFDVPVAPGQLHLRQGDLVDLVSQGAGHDALPPTKKRSAARARISCTLPEVLAHVREGHRIWFDDGRIGGEIRRCEPDRVEVEITEARSGGERLAADKGINLPDTPLELAALTPKDLEDLEVVVRHADIVGLSFAQSAEDVRALRRRLAALGAPDLGMILKIETRRGFEHLPEMLLAAMAGPATGVMIARGDLAVECGYERLAEVQEEILWACEAAHVPVVWATQVLETLARTGLPSRAEITDAAMGGRAECVMLNKGPHVLSAIRTLDDILRRMQSHQHKKRPLLRALAAWAGPQPEPLATRH